MKRLRKTVSLFVLSAVLASSIDGCLSVGIDKVGKPSPGVETGSLRVSVTQHSPVAGVLDPPRYPLVSELYRVDRPQEPPIREVSESRWTEDGLAPGKYRIRVARYIDERGEVRPLERAVEKKFSIRAGETLVADIVVKRFPTGTVVSIGAAVAGGILIAAVISFFTSFGRIGTISLASSKKHRKQLDTRPLPAPHAAPFPSALGRSFFSEGLRP
jgi:hypothetical protein